MSASTATAPTAEPVDQSSPLARRLCWHAIEICRALDHGIAELQLAIAEATEHTDALIELAVALAGVEPRAGELIPNAVEGARP